MTPLRARLLALPLCLFSAVAPASPSDTLPPEPPCPAVAIVVPDFPLDEVKRSRASRTVIEAELDACGRVTASRVFESSTHRVLDRVAREAVNRSVFDTSRAVQGRVRVPFVFKSETRRDYWDKRVDWWKTEWPQTHRRVRYVSEPATTDFGNAAEAIAGIRARDGAVSRWPVHFFSEVVDFPEAEPREIWQLFDGSTVWRKRNGEEGNLAPERLAARYRVDLDGGEPVIRFSLLCDAPLETCALAQEQLMNGLPFAKAIRLTNAQRRVLEARARAKVSE